MSEGWGVDIEIDCRTSEASFSSSRQNAAWLLLLATKCRYNKQNSRDHYLLCSKVNLRGDLNDATLPMLCGYLYLQGTYLPIFAVDTFPIIILPYAPNALCAADQCSPRQSGKLRSLVGFLSQDATVILSQSSNIFTNSDTFFVKRRDMRVFL